MTMTENPVLVDLIVMPSVLILGRVRLGYPGIRIYSGKYSGMYSGYCVPRSIKAGMEIQVLLNENSSQRNAYSHDSNYSYSTLIPNESALNDIDDKKSKRRSRCSYAGMFHFRLQLPYTIATCSSMRKIPNRKGLINSNASAPPRAEKG